MHPSPTLAQVLKDRGVRSAVATLGLIIYGLGMYLQMQAGIGLSPWNSLTLGLSRLTGTSFGTASIAISLAIVLLALPGLLYLTDRFFIKKAAPAALPAKEAKPL